MIDGLQKLLEQNLTMNIILLSNYHGHLKFQVDKYLKQKNHTLLNKSLMN